MPVVNRINEYNLLLQGQLGQNYRMIIEFDDYLKIKKYYPPQENYKSGQPPTKFPSEDKYLVTNDTLQYESGESNLDRFYRVLQVVTHIIDENIEIINSNLERYMLNLDYINAQLCIERINLSFKNIYRLLDLLFDMLNDMFTLDHTFVDILGYYGVLENGLSLILRSACASEGIPPSRSQP